MVQVSVGHLDHSWWVKSTVGVFSQCWQFCCLLLFGIHSFVMLVRVAEIYAGLVLFIYLFYHLHFFYMSIWQVLVF